MQQTSFRRRNYKKKVEKEMIKELKEKLNKEVKRSVSKQEREKQIRNKDGAVPF